MEMWDTAGRPHNPTLVPVTFSCHSIPNTPLLNSPKREQDLMKKEKKNSPFGIVIFLFTASTC